ncbi:phosphatase domain-containing protein [Actinomycetes bacterium KLBMP 9759]
MVRAQLRKLLVRAAMIVEDIVQEGVLLALRLRGRHHPMVVPFIGHGTTRKVRVGARVVYGRPEVAAPAVGVPSAAEPTRRSRRAILRSSIARFLTVEVPGAMVQVGQPLGPRRVRTDRDGYLDAVLDVEEITPGWHEVALELKDGARASAQVLVVDPESEIGIVSDVDDTIVETGISRGMEFVRATLLTETRDRTPLPGAAALYRALVEAAGPPRPVFYLSTSPWNLHEMLLEFIALRRFPLGPLLLTDWGPSKSGLFRIGAQEHKLGVVRRLLGEHPRLSLVLIGDSGQADPEIYATLAREYPERICAVYIRRTRHALRSRVLEVDALAAEVTAAGVPMLAVDDSTQIAAHAATIGLLHPDALSEIS